MCSLKIAEYAVLHEIHSDEKIVSGKITDSLSTSKNDSVKAKATAW